MSNNITEHEIARIKRDSKKIAKILKNTELHHRAYLFTGIAANLGKYGEEPMSALFSGIASTYIRKKG